MSQYNFLHPFFVLVFRVLTKRNKTGLKRTLPRRRSDFEEEEEECFNESRFSRERDQHALKPPFVVVSPKTPKTPLLLYQSPPQRHDFDLREK